LKKGDVYKAQERNIKSKDVFNFSEEILLKKS